MPLGPADWLDDRFREEVGGVSVFQMGLVHIIAGRMGAGMFERYPRLRMSFGESGAGWLAYAAAPGAEGKDRSVVV